jgi:hypothetical protein
MDETSSHNHDTLRAKVRPFWVGISLSALFIPAYLVLVASVLIVVLACWPMFAQPATLCVVLCCALLSCVPAAVWLHRTLDKASLSWSVLSLTLTVSILAGGVTAFVFAAGRIKTFRNEDRVHSVYMPVVNAVYTYSRNHDGLPPESFRRLIPGYLAALPDDPQHLVRYEVTEDGTNWTLSVLCRNGTMYMHRTGNRYTESERNRITRVFHQTWAVFPDQK